MLTTIVLTLLLFCFFLKKKKMICCNIKNYNSWFIEFQGVWLTIFDVQGGPKVGIQLLNVEFRSKSRFVVLM